MYFCWIFRKCTLRRSTQTRPTSSFTSSRGSTTPSSCQRSMARRWLTPVAWTKTLSQTTRNIVSSSDCPPRLPFSQHYTCSLLLPAVVSRTQQTFSQTVCIAALSTLDFKHGLEAKGFAETQWSPGESTKLVHFDELYKTNPSPHPPPVNNSHHNTHVTYTRILTHLRMYAVKAKWWSDVVLLLCIYHLWCQNGEKTKTFTPGVNT